MKAAFPILAQRRPGAGRRRNLSAGNIVPVEGERSRDGGAEGVATIRTIRGLLLVQSTIFFVLASIHFGLLIDGYRHQNAGATESLIAAILVVGLLLTWIPRWSRRAAIVVQSFGTMGVLVGLITAALGIRPLTILDLTFNGVLLLTLVAGLAMILRNR